MRKGDKARQELIACAAELFDLKGYERVSIKDIADTLGWTKSLFYYYCADKEQIVRLAARARIDAMTEGLPDELDACTNAVQRINLLLSEVGFWHRDAPETAARNLLSLYRQENLPWRVYLEDAMVNSITPLFVESVKMGLKSNEIFAPGGIYSAESALSAARSMSDRIADSLLNDGDSALSESTSRLGAYRSIIERILEAPYGSINIIDVSCLQEILLCARQLKTDGFLSDI